MNLKPFVNNSELWDAFNEEISAYINQAHYSMEQAENEELFRLQGEVRAYRKLKQLRERVNSAA